MTTRVRALTDDEKGRLSPVLHELHTHVAGCDVCGSSTRKREMCDAGRELFERWLTWLDASEAPPF